MAIAKAPNSTVALLGYQVVNAEMGRLKEACGAAEKRLKLWPAYNLGFLKLGTSHMAKGYQTRLIAGSRKAGIPEYPFNFNPAQFAQLTGDQIGKNLVGKRLVGKATYLNRPFWMEMDAAGTYVSSHFTGEVRDGTFKIVNDTVCWQTEANLLRREYCTTFFANPEGTKAAQDEYFHVTVFDVYRFSVVD